MVNLSPEVGYIHLDALVWDDATLQSGKLKRVPLRVRLFNVLAPEDHIKWAITNDPNFSVTCNVAHTQCDVRWRIEEPLWRLKKLADSEHGQSRVQRSQRTHLTLCYQAWLSLKIVAHGWAQHCIRSAPPCLRSICATLAHPHMPVLYGI